MSIFFILVLVCYLVKWSNIKQQSAVEYKTSASHVTIQVLKCEGTD